MLAVILALIAAGLFFILINHVLLEMLCIIAAVLIAIAGFFSKTKTTAERIGKSGKKGMWKGLQEAETGHPDKAILDDAVSGAGEISGQQVGAPDSHKFKATNNIGGAAEKMIDYFKKAFK